jgi:hypothetical protein
MHGLGYQVYHCPCCGTVKDTNGAFHIPALVGRCRLLLHGAVGRENGLGELTSEAYEEALRIATRLGIVEAIHPPGDSNDDGRQDA